MTGQRTDAHGGRVTLHTVASEAGVSVSTVSRVLNDRADVSADTKERVEAVMDVVGYQRRPARRRARADGYRATMERAELPVPAGFAPHGEFNDASGRRETARLLDRLAAAGEEPPTAIFAASDLQALGAFEELRARGRRIPEDISIVGFDDLPVARWTHPPLTTVRQPLFDMAAMAANTLLRIIDGEPVANLRLELATQLVVRGSTAPPA
ncbi:LacI family DNA-binding transcriptional regulator [Streptomyces sp. NPDC093089]|uniref:LacI family DNA-binding transcriptional regulator n=1 Tax=Streptomyces sp. NPDC093089 TaxID=3366024 RepID=UPI003814C97E